MLKKIKVLIVDDSALVRDILTRILESDPGIEVVGTARDVYSARDKIVFRRPDVLTLDVEMPRMDGIEFLKRLMPQYPLPVVMVSSMTAEGSRVTLDALEAGAVDFVLKPSAGIGAGLREMAAELIEKVKTAATADMNAYRRTLVTGSDRERQIKPAASGVLEGTTDRVIAIGASTGGTVALTRILETFPANIPGTVVVQHMPPGFTKMFANSLNSVCKAEVAEARDGDRIITGRILIAPGDYHMEVVRSGGQYLVSCHQRQDKVNGHRPSVDVLFRSVANNVGSNAVGVILTGMGRDGADGMLEMRQAGARTLAQDEASSVVFGMPKEALLNGGAEKAVPLAAVGAEVGRMLGGGPVK